jgi:hypothetical protein
MSDLKINSIKFNTEYAAQILGYDHLIMLGLANDKEKTYLIESSEFTQLDRKEKILFYKEALNIIHRKIKTYE